MTVAFTLVMVVLGTSMTARGGGSESQAAMLDAPSLDPTLILKFFDSEALWPNLLHLFRRPRKRSEERRVGKEC